MILHEYPDTSPVVCNSVLSAPGFRPMGVLKEIDGNNERRGHLHSPGGAIVPAGCRSSSVVALYIPALTPSLLLSKEVW